MFTHLGINTVELRYSEALHNEVLCTMNDFLYPVIVKYMKKNLDIMKHCFSKHILPVPWPFVKSRFHRNLVVPKTVGVQGRDRY